MNDREPFLHSQVRAPWYPHTPVYALRPVKPLLHFSEQNQRGDHKVVEQQHWHALDILSPL